MWKASWLNILNTHDKVIPLYICVLQKKTYTRVLLYVLVDLLHLDFVLPNDLEGVALDLVIRNVDLHRPCGPRALLHELRGESRPLQGVLQRPESI